MQKFPALADHVPSQEELVQNVGAAAKGAGALLVAVASRMTAGTAAFLLDLFIMIYAMFFFFKGWRENPGADFLLHPAES